MKSKNTYGPGTKAKSLRIAPGVRVDICCMAPDRRDCLERVMNAWHKHKKELPKILLGKRYRPGVYAFAYWLIRWSGLVKPTKFFRQDFKGVTESAKCRP